MYSKKFRAIDISDKKILESSHMVAIEETVELFINDMPMASILATPDMLEELAVGYLIGEGVVRSADEIKGIDLGEDYKVFAYINPTEHFEVWQELRSSGCVGVRWQENEDIHVVSNTRFKPKMIWSSLRFLESEVYRDTRGTHAACLINSSGECIIKAVDVGRHNAFDKVIGRAILDKIDLGSHFLLSTGRQSAGMVLKAARAGIPLIATKTAPLNSGIESAERTGVCLICFASDGRMSIFAHPERVEV